MQPRRSWSKAEEQSVSRKYGWLHKVDIPIALLSPLYLHDSELSLLTWTRFYRQSIGVVSIIVCSNEWLPILLKVLSCLLYDIAIHSLQYTTRHSFWNTKDKEASFVKDAFNIHNKPICCLPNIPNLCHRSRYYYCSIQQPRIAALHWWCWCLFELVSNDGVLLFMDLLLSFRGTRNLLLQALHYHMLCQSSFS